MQSLEKLQGKTGKGVGLPLPALYWIGLNHNLGHDTKSTNRYNQAGPTLDIESMDAFFVAILLRKKRHFVLNLNPGWKI